MKNISIIIPVFNEEGNIPELIIRLHNTLTGNNFDYELIFVDDNSTDDSVKVIESYSTTYPIRLCRKKGRAGKAFSLLEGFSKASYEALAMIDADLQYPPEYIPTMYDKLQNADIIVANRKERHTSFLRKVTSRGFMLIFAKYLHNIQCDAQSGLKVFKKEILERINLKPTPWTFDLEFLVKANSAGYKIDSYDITFHDRKYGRSKVKMLQTIWEIGKSALKLKLSQSEVFPLIYRGRKEHGKGFHYKGSRYTPHTNLKLSESAFFRLTTAQFIGLFLLGLSIITALIFNWHITVIFLVALLTTLYFADIFFNLFLIIKSFRSNNTQEIKKELINNAKLPSYTILCPLYKEWEVLPQFISSIQKLEYPKDKLQVLLLLEENDKDTIQKARTFFLPEYFQLIIVPESIPKTKPKACNYGLNFASGDYAVIYDAEDIPEKDQLKKAVMAFQGDDERLACVQAKLNFYNPNQNNLTRLFTSEYSLWFDMVLIGLQSLNAPIPLGGTSNHFKTEILKKLHGWDAFNVTEDCDLGVRLAKKGYKTAILDSTTFEEANSETRNWIHQRSRWIKGYLQTYLVHLRSLAEFSENKNTFSIFAFQLIVGGKVLSLFINPLMWAILISYFTLRPVIGPFIESFYPAPILYMAAFSIIFGNFLYLYYYMIGAIKNGYYSLVLSTFFVPIYWLLMSIASWVALHQLIKSPHYWAKTKHGLHLSMPGSKIIHTRTAI